MTWPPNSRLYRDAFGHRSGDEYEAERVRLSVGLSDLRRRADVLANQIAHDLPEFTEHDGSHLDALWPLADSLLPDDVTLTPTEAYVLGAAIVLHDLGLAASAYPGGRRALRSSQLWRDVVGGLFRDQQGRAPTVSDIASLDADLLLAADRTVLRLQHGERAALLPYQHWVDHRGERRYLIQDEDLREDFGHVIGQIAASHLWSVDEIARRFNRTLGPPAMMPREWVVRPVLVACLLRVADASHLNGARAPRWSRVHRSMGANSAAHWEFQERLSSARVDGEVLRFTSLRPFDPDSADAWWTCWDALQVVDRELRDSDRVLVDLGLPRLRPRRVDRGESPARLATVVQTANWQPVDARVDVSDVARLVARLGGGALYGQTPLVPVRELLANASDATRARAILSGEAPRPIVVRERAVGDDWLIEVDDGGIGMSPIVLTSALIDFGRSLWHSDDVLDVAPGLLSSEYEPIGEFGIGFFSCFMWSNRIEVVSRDFRDAVSATTVLDFKGGLSVRPRLRDALPAERRPSGGTLVRLHMERQALLEHLEGVPETSYEVDTFIQSVVGQLPSTGARVVASLCPTFQSDIVVECDQKSDVAVAANDWLTMSSVALFDRVIHPVVRFGARRIHPFSETGRLLTPIEEADGTIVGRAALVPPGMDIEMGAVTVGGLRVFGLKRIAGVVLGASPNAARTDAALLASKEAVAAWATRQAELWSGVELDATAQEVMAGELLSLGALPGDLRFLRSSHGRLSIVDVHELAAKRRAPFYLVQTESVELAATNVAKSDAELRTPSGNMWELSSVSGVRWTDLKLRAGVLGYTFPPRTKDLDFLAGYAENDQRQDLAGAILKLVWRILALAWATSSPEDVRLKPVEITVGTVAGEKISAKALRLSPPTRVKPR